MKWLVCLSIVVLASWSATFTAAQAPDNEALYPEITFYPQTDLVGVGDVIKGGLLKIPCKTIGSPPLTHKWYFNGHLINVNVSKKFSLDGDGSLIIQNMQLKRGPRMYQCVVSNGYGTVFSAKRKVDVTAINTPFKAGPSRHLSKIYFSYGHPLIIQCPRHEVHLGANYSWGTYTNDHFEPLKESKYHAVTTKGTLVIAAFRNRDQRSILYCKVSVGPTYYISHGFGLSSAKSKTPFGSNLALSPALVEKPDAFEMVLRGSTKILRCIPTGNPVPHIVWWKDGDLISSKENDMHLESFDRVLVIKNVNEKTHKGKYQCGYGNHASTRRVLTTSHLHVIGPPIMSVVPPKGMSMDAGKTLTLHCKAKQMYSSYPDTVHYEWYMNAQRLANGGEISIEKNTLFLNATQAKDSGVYQCVAKNTQGMVTAATKVHIIGKSCRAIPPPFNSKFTEASCHQSASFQLGSRCTVLCARGFFGKGHRNYRKCMDDGGWSVMQYECEDYEPPTLKKGYECPKDIVMATERANNTGIQVTWKLPVAEDNSGRLETTIEPHGIKGNSHWFPLGATVVKYTFTDWSGKKISCQFTVTVFLRTQIVTKPPSLIYILKGKSLELECRAQSSFPPIYTWTRSKFTEPDTVVKLKIDSSLQLLDGGRRLVFSHVSERDSGKYTCEVVNIQYSLPGVRDTAVTSVDVLREVVWSPWQKWANCSVKCGKGLQTRTRTCFKKHSRRPARGCEGKDKQSKACHVVCTKPHSNKQPVLLPGFKNLVVKYEVAARGWLKENYPKLHEFLSSTNGRFVFAVVLIVAGAIFVLIIWACGHFLCQAKKKKVHFEGADEKLINDENNKQQSFPVYENLQSAPVHDNVQSSPIYENVQSSPIYENLPVQQDYNEGYDEDQEEIIYEDMRG